MALNLEYYPRELKNPFENRNKAIRTNGPIPNTKRTIFAVLGVVFSSIFFSTNLEVIFFLDFFLGLFRIVFRYYNSSYNLRVKIY